VNTARDRSQAESPNAAREELYRRFSKAGVSKLKARRLRHTLAWVLVVQPLSWAKRIFDIAFSLLILLGFSPILLGLGLVAAFKALALRPVPRLGRHGERFNEYRFTFTDSAVGRLLSKLRLARLPVLVNILKGDMSFIGPRPVSPDEMSPREGSVRRRHEVRPGLICLWWIRRRANIDYGWEVDSDAEYVDTHTIRSDLGIWFRALPASLYGERGAVSPEQVTALGIKVDNLAMAEAVEAIVTQAGADTPRQLCFVNADCANIAYRDPVYRRLLNAAWLTLADGIGMKVAAKLLGVGIKQNVNGTDLFPRLCQALSGSGKGLFLLGALPGVAESVAAWITARYPQVVISGVKDGFFSLSEEEAVADLVAESGASVLLVALGAPRQDVWINRNLGRTGVKVAMGVGGLFDFYSGRISRAPMWVREIGMEWLYRLVQEPGRMWKRYFLGNSLFLFRVIKERWKLRRA
jgi:N-acetylglucosaminyldiphosphoundecaprenol N-acetyl-beta-D-mannosaminyltransferase